MTFRLPTPLIIGLLAAVVFTAVLFNAPPVRNDLGYFLPHSAEPVRQLLLDEIQHGPATKLLLLAIDGEDPAQLAETSQALAGHLRSTDLFSMVANGAPAPTVAAPDNSLFQYRYLLSRSIADDSFSLSRLREALEVRLDELASMVGSFYVKDSLAADPTAAYREVVRDLLPRYSPSMQHGVWFSRDGQTALMLLATHSPGFELEEQATTQETIRSAFRDIALGEQRLTLSGPAVFAVDARERIRQESMVLSIVASVSVFLLLLITFRSLRSSLLAAIPLAAAVLTGAAAVTVIFGSLHGITLAFGVSLVGVAVDYPLHLFAHMAMAGRLNAASLIWPTLRLSVGTTVIGFSALLLSGFGGLAELGVFAISGLIAAAATTRWLLPALVRSKPELHGSRLASAVFGSFDRIPMRRWIPLLGGALGIALILARGDSLWERDLSRLSPVSSDLKAVDGMLRHELGAPDVNRLLVITGDTSEQVLQECEALELHLEQAIGQGALRGYDAPCRYIPSQQRQRERQELLPKSSDLRDKLVLAQHGLPFRHGLFEPFITDVERSHRLLPLTPQAIPEPILAQKLEGLLRPTPQGWIGLLPLIGIEDSGSVESLAKQDTVFYVDLAQQTQELMDDYRNQALASITLGLVMIMLLLGLALKSIPAMVRVLLPSFSAILLSVAILTLLGHPLSLFHVIALLLVLGLGLDFALFRERHGWGDERNATATALLLSALSTVLVFAMLALASAPVLSGIGLSVVIGAPLSLIFTALMTDNKASAQAQPSRNLKI